nr:MAG TPA: putative endonuclease [Caudoviricetes sp.]DAQ44239.1 MAG TPA: putative endonuclease [Bacteriophage sp.]
MNTNQVGKITELEVLSYVVRCGYSVSLPFGDKDRYD